MEQVLKVNGVSIKASKAKDSKGRAGYFIAKSDLPKTHELVVVYKTARKTKTTRKQDASIRPEVEQSLKEMRDYKDGKLKLRPIDEFLKTI